jgi:hypothetical protein
VYRTVIYWGRLGEQLGEDQMSRNYSSTIVAMYRRKNIFGICFSMVFDGWLTYGWNFPVPEVELGEGPLYVTSHGAFYLGKHKVERDILISPSDLTD